jgi:hypothetical protein
MCLISIQHRCRGFYEVIVDSGAAIHAVNSPRRPVDLTPGELTPLAWSSPHARL